MKVRAGNFYRFEPFGYDVFRPAHQGLQRGDIVKVVNLHGCPPANTMGHCHVQRDGVFMGLVQCGSLHHVKPPRKSRAKLDAVRSVVRQFIDSGELNVDAPVAMARIADITHPIKGATHGD